MLESRLLQARCSMWKRHLKVYHLIAGSQYGMSIIHRHCLQKPNRTLLEDNLE
jgi:hypothetical protein